MPSARANCEYPLDPAAVVTVKLESVVVSAKVKEISLASVVVIVFPPLYAFCSVNAAFAQVTTLFDPSRHRVVPAADERPVIVMYEPPDPSVVKVTSFAPSGLNVDDPNAWKV